MKRFSVLFALCAIVFSALPAAAADLPEGVNARTARKLARNPVKARALANVCPRTVTWSNGQGLIKSQISHHISRGDPRATGYTLVCGSQCPSRFPASFYYSDGTEAGKLGYYGTFSGNGKPRAYCGTGGAGRCYVSTISRIARRKRTGSSLYLKLNRTTCVQFNGSPGARNGGV